MTLEHVSPDASSATEVGSMLFTRGVSGTRVLTGTQEKTVEGHTFKCKCSCIL